MGAFLSIARDVKLLCNYQDATVAEFEVRFRRYRNLDFIMVLIFILGFVLTLVLTNKVSSEFGGKITGNKYVDAALPAGMALLFLGDGTLMILLMKHITGWKSGIVSSQSWPSSHSVSSLRKETMVNVATNFVTFVAYVGWRVLIILESEQALSELLSGTQRIFLAVLYVGSMLLKLTKIFVMAAFARYLNTQGNSSPLPLRMNPMAEVALHPTVAPAANARSLAQEPGHV